MRIPTLFCAVLGLTLAARCSLASADDIEELEFKARALKSQAAELMENGQREQGEKLARQSKELMMKARQLAEKKSSARDSGDHPDVIHLKQRLKELRAERERAEFGDAPEHEKNELREQIGQTERKLAQVLEHGHRGEITPQFREQVEKLENAARRMQHIRVAAENLMAAEMPDMAHELMKKAEAMEHEIQSAKKELAMAMSEAQEHRHDGGVEKLRSENDQLRRELNELREAVERLRSDRAEDDKVGK